MDINDLKTGGNRIKTSGGWLTALIGHMLKATDHEFACTTFGSVKSVQEAHHDRISCFVVPGDLVGNAMDKSLRLCRDLIRKWDPDLIHVHGTEAAYGLLTARNMVDIPALVSLQGLLGPYSEWYRYFGKTSFLDIIRMHRWLEILTMRGHWMTFCRIRKMAQREHAIIKGNRFFMGRTAWDRAYVAALNPAAKYYHGGELMREAFWHQQWRIEKVKRHRVIFTNAGGYPRKGTEILLEAVKLLQPHYPDIEVAIAGNISRRSGYGRYVLKLITELGYNAIELGQLNAEKMAEELIYSHVFVSPSYIDNSPNAVCEAQLLGMPVVSTYTGGVPSLIEENRTGLFFPTGDAPMLAARLRNVFEDDDLATRLGSDAHDAAIKRHDPGTVLKDILESYEIILQAST